MCPESRVRELLSGFPGTSGKFSEEVVFERRLGLSKGYPRRLRSSSVSQLGGTKELLCSFGCCLGP